MHPCGVVAKKSRRSRKLQLTGGQLQISNRSTDEKRELKISIFVLKFPQNGDFQPKFGIVFSTC